MAEGFWNRVAAFEGRTLRTVRGRPFGVKAVTSTAVRIVIQSTGRERTIPRSRLESGSALKQPGERIRPSTLRQAGVTEVNPAYVAAILNTLDDSSLELKE